eukprot:746070-Rhodomonas_salina.3
MSRMFTGAVTIAAVISPATVAGTQPAAAPAINATPLVAAATCPGFSEVGACGLGGLTEARNRCGAVIISGVRTGETVAVATDAKIRQHAITLRLMVLLSLYRVDRDPRGGGRRRKPRF